MVRETGRALLAPQRTAHATYEAISHDDGTGHYRAVIVCPIASCLKVTARHGSTAAQARERAVRDDRKHWNTVHRSLSAQPAPAC
jgi:hypothetical protein